MQKVLIAILFVLPIHFIHGSSAIVDLKTLMNNCLKNASYYQSASESLSWFVSTDARSYFMCSGDEAKALYDYMGNYTKDLLQTHNGKIHFIRRVISDNSECALDPDTNNVNCSFDLYIDEDIIAKEEQN